jgi:hypothetical protein
MGATRAHIPASNSANGPVAAAIAPQVKSIPHQNSNNQSQQQPRYQEAKENGNQNTLKPASLYRNNIRPLANVVSPYTQTNESSSFRSPLGEPTGNHSKFGLLSVSVKVANDPVTVGKKQNVIVLVSDATSNDKVSGAEVVGQVTKSSGLLKKEFQASTDDNGQVWYSWKIKQTVNSPDTYKVAVTILAPGYQKQTAATSFTVNPSTSSSPLMESPFNSNTGVNDNNNNNNLLSNRIHDFTNKILDDVKQNTKDKWTLRHFILPTPF